MNKEIPRRKVSILSRKNKAAEGERKSPGGFHFGDYRPRYQDSFDIYEKAKKHVREQKKKDLKNMKKVVDTDERLC